MLGRLPEPRPLGGEPRDLLLERHRMHQVARRARERRRRERANRGDERATYTNAFCRYHQATRSSSQTAPRTRSKQAYPFASNRAAQRDARSSLTCSVPPCWGTAALKSTTSAARQSATTNASALVAGRCSATSTEMHRSWRLSIAIAPARSVGRKSMRALRSFARSTHGPSRPVSVVLPSASAAASHEPCPQPTSITLSGLNTRYTTGSTAAAERGELSAWSS